MATLDDDIYNGLASPADDKTLDYLYDAFEEFITNAENENVQTELPLKPNIKVPNMSESMKLALTDLIEDSEQKSDSQKLLINRIEPETEPCETAAENVEPKVVVKSRWNDIRTLTKINGVVRPPLRKAKSEGDALLSRRVSQLSVTLPSTEEKKQEKEIINEDERSISKTTKDLLLRSRRLSDTIERNRSLYNK